MPRATLEMGAPPYAGWERRCIVCAHVREDHWLCVSPAAVHGLVGSTHKSAYVASKHGVVGFSKVVSGWAGVRGPCASYALPLPLRWLWEGLWAPPVPGLPHRRGPQAGAALQVHRGAGVPVLIPHCGLPAGPCTKVRVVAKDQELPGSVA